MKVKLTPCYMPKLYSIITAFGFPMTNKETDVPVNHLKLTVSLLWDQDPSLVLLDFTTRSAGRSEKSGVVGRKCAALTTLPLPSLKTA